MGYKQGCASACCPFQDEVGKNGDEDGDGNGDHVCMYCTAGMNTKT